MKLSENDANNVANTFCTFCFVGNDQVKSGAKLKVFEHFEFCNVNLVCSFR